MKTNLIQDYKVLEGQYNHNMPKLVKDNYTPLTTKDLMEFRIKAIQSKNQDEIDFWLNHYFDTATSLAYFNNELVIDPKSNLLLNINPETKLSNNSIPLSPEQFNELKKQYEVIHRNEVILGKSLTKDEAKKSKIWLKLAQEDKSLLNEYTGLIFSEAKSRYNYDENMGIYLPNDQEEPALRAWFVWSLGNRSDADARDGLDGNARLAGVRAQNLQAKNTYTKDQIIQALKETKLIGLEKILLEKLDEK